jgi:hypothetical protein
MTVMTDLQDRHCRAFRRQIRCHGVYGQQSGMHIGYGFLIGDGRELAGLTVEIGLTKVGMTLAGTNTVLK